MGLFDNQFTPSQSESQPDQPDWLHQPEPQPEPQPESQPVEDKPKDKPKDKPNRNRSRAKGGKAGLTAAQVAQVLDARALLDSPHVRDVLVALGVKNADADMTAAVLDGAAREPVSLLLDAADENSATMRVVLLIGRTEKDARLARRCRDVLDAVDPDAIAAAGEPGKGDMALCAWLSDAVALVDLSGLEALR